MLNAYFSQIDTIPLWSSIKVSNLFAFVECVNIWRSNLQSIFIQNLLNQSHSWSMWEIVTNKGWNDSNLSTIKMNNNSFIHSSVCLFTFSQATRVKRSFLFGNANVFSNQPITSIITLLHQQWCKHEWQWLNANYSP